MSEPKTKSTCEINAIKASKDNFSQIITFGDSAFILSAIIFSF